MIAIGQECPDQPEIIALIEALDAYQGSLYPAESNHLLPIDALLADDVYFAVARCDGKAVGIGALKKYATYAEVKRMFVLPALRGQGISLHLMAHLEAHAHAQGLTSLRLETGIKQDAAISLYSKCGFVFIGPFGDYEEDPLSVFMEKTL